MFNSLHKTQCISQYLNENWSVLTNKIERRAWSMKWMHILFCDFSSRKTCNILLKLRRICNWNTWDYDRFSRCFCSLPCQRRRMPNGTLHTFRNRQIKFKITFACNVQYVHISDTELELKWWAAIFFFRGLGWSWNEQIFDQVFFYSVSFVFPSFSFGFGLIFRWRHSSISLISLEIELNFLSAMSWSE